jgi:hypothetical protein
MKDTRIDRQRHATRPRFFLRIGPFEMRGAWRCDSGGERARVRPHRTEKKMDRERVVHSGHSDAGGAIFKSFLPIIFSPFRVSPFPSLLL